MKRRQVIGGLIILIWLAAVFALYYAGHKPFTLANAVASCRTLGVLINNICPGLSGGRAG